MKNRMKITELACSSTFDEFYDILSETVPINRADALVKYEKLRKHAKSQQKPKLERVDYYAYLKSKKWAKKRRKALFKAKHKCECCGATEELHVHHLSYKRLGKEPLSDLKVLCRNCHCNVHENDGKALSDSTKAFMEMARGF
jgi:5-methylcytosine-specific restriction endonuclease McrA